jgi:hypothetical protein
VSRVRKVSEECVVWNDGVTSEQCTRGGRGVERRIHSVDDEIMEQNGCVANAKRL